MELLQNDTVPELYLPSPAPPGGALAYLLPRGSQAPPAKLSLEESWAQWPGAYLFLVAPVAAGTEAAFADAAWAFLADRRLAGTRFAWLQVPPPPGLVSGTTIQVQGSGSSTSLAFAATLPLVSLELGLAAGTAVELDSAAEAFRFSATKPGGIGLSADWGNAAAGSVTGPATLPLNGPLAGCLQAAIAFATADLATIDAGLRFFYAAPPRSPSTPATPNFFLDSLRLPLFAAGLNLYANLDPLAPLTPARSFFAFHGADAGQPSAPEPAPAASHLRTTLGEPVALKPLTGSAAPSGFAALVLAPRPLASVATPRDPAYLVPRGDFAPEGVGAQLMCGLSGVEYVGLAAAGSVLSFFPGAESFAKGFAPGKPPGYSSLTPTDTPTTAFAQVTAAVPGARLKYFAQPDQSVLYNHGDLAPSGFTALSAVAVQAGELAGPPSAAHAFPLLPYAGLDGSELEPFAQLESQVISPLRRATIAAAQSAVTAPKAEPAAALTSRLSTTPQGLLAAYVPGATKWEEIVLGQMADGSQLRLADVEGELLAAFQSNKLFLVATLPSSMSSLEPGGSQIVLGEKVGETWTFDLDPARWSENQTILILKFHNLAIAELAKDPATWAAPEHFNTAPAEVSKALLEAIAAADPSDPDFAAFRTAVEDPSWNGVLALNIHCPLQNLPAQLAGLAAGIDGEEFRAHHVGIALSQIDAAGSQLSISSSSIFALLDYTAPAPLPAQAGEYAFQVERLKVRFEESAVASFSSIVDLQVNRLFGEPATLTDPSPGVTENVVQLYGVYQQHVVAGKVEGTYTFQTRSGQVSDFTMTSAVLNAVTLAKGQFVTVAGQGSPGETVSQFLFWGQLDFHELPFDAFSFGRELPTDPATGLAFGNLIVTMEFDPAAQPPGPRFEFDAAQLALDVAASAKPREHSLFRHFPLTVAGFSQGKSGTTPDGLGYMGLQTPLTQSPLTYPWFALSYDLDLGSAGALAAEAGFVATLCVAWSPGVGSDYHVFTGLRLPGSSGAKRQIPIEGIFDIGFRALAIESPAADTFALVLYGIGFQFLSFTFPPSGQVNFTLFGDPHSTGPDDTTLGWYAAYAKPDAKPAQR